MPDISIDRLEDIANVPECAKVDEVRDIAYLLMEARGLVQLRNIQNRKLKVTANNYLAANRKWFAGIRRLHLQWAGFYTLSLVLLVLAIQ